MLLEQKQEQHIMSTSIPNRKENTTHISDDTAVTLD